MSPQTPILLLGLCVGILCHWRPDDLPLWGVLDSWLRGGGIDELVPSFALCSEPHHHRWPVKVRRSHTSHVTQHRGRSTSSLQPPAPCNPWKTSLCEEKDFADVINPGLSGWCNLISQIFEKGGRRVGQETRREKVSISHCSLWRWRRGPWAKKRRWPLKVVTSAQYTASKKLGTLVL